MALGYKIALTNVWWNRGGQDTRLFSSVAEQQTYFANKGLYYNDLVNFNIKDNITTTIVFRDKSGRGAEELLKCNYAVVWNTIANTYRYYFIVSIEQDSSNQVIASLDLDDVNTNIVPNINNIGLGLVKRWTGYNYIKDNGNYTFKFNPLNRALLPYTSDGDRPMLVNNTTSVVKIKHTYNDAINNWLYQNVVCWKYIFLIDNQKLMVRSFSSASWDRENIVSNCQTDALKGELLPYGAIACPVYKDNAKRIYITYNINDVDYYLRLEPSSFYALYSTLYTIQGTEPKYNYQGTYGIEKKISNICPLRFYTCAIDSDGDLIIKGKVRNYNEIEIVDGDDISFDYCYFYKVEGALGSNISKAMASLCIVSGYTQENSTYEATATHSLRVSSPVANDDNMALLNIDYSKLNIRITNQSYSYNPIKLINSNNQDTIDLLYTEVLKAGVSKIYLRAKSSNLITTPMQEDYTGLIASLDLTEPLLSNQWADYFASHKNYYMQTALNQSLNLVKGAGHIAGSESSSQALTRFADTELNFLMSKMNTEFDKDNIQKSPDSLANANGDPYFYSAVADIRPRLDTYSVQLDLHNTKQIKDKFLKYGLPYNQYFKFSYVINRHELYDALSFDLDQVNANLSSKEFIRLKDYLSQTHRYWHIDKAIDSFSNWNGFIET